MPFALILLPGILAMTGLGLYISIKWTGQSDVAVNSFIASLATFGLACAPAPFAETDGHRYLWQRHD